MRTSLTFLIATALLLSLAPLINATAPADQPQVMDHFPPEGTAVNKAHLKPKRDFQRRVAPGRVALLIVFANGQGCNLDTESGAPADPWLPWLLEEWHGPTNFAVGEEEGVGGQKSSVIVTAPGAPSTLPIRVFSPAGPNPVLLGEVKLPPSTAPNGRFIAMANVNGDTANEIFVTGGPKGPGNVEAIDGNGRIFVSFNPFPQSPDDELRLSFGDIVGADNRAEMIVTRAHGGDLKIFTFDHGVDPIEIGHGFPFDVAPTGGVFTAAADINNDGIADLVVARGSGAPHVRMFSFAEPTPIVIGDFLAFSPEFTGGVRLAAGIIDARPVVLATSGPAIRSYSPNELLEWIPSPTFQTYPYGRVLPGGMRVGIFTPNMPQ